MGSLNKSYERLSSWFYDHHQGGYHPDEIPTFSEWVDSLSNSELIMYLTLGEDLQEEESRSAYETGYREGLSKGDYYEGIEEGIKIGRLQSSTD